MSTVDRRQILKALVAAGFVPATAAAQARERLTPEILEKAQSLLDRGFDDERLRELLPAIQRNLDFFQIVRDVDIDDLVEPAPVFHATPGHIRRSR